MLKKIGLGMLLLLLLSACSAGSESQEQAMDTESGAALEEKTEEMDVSLSNATESKEETPIESANRMVIYKADLRLEVEDFQSSLEAIELKTNQYGGYVVESSTYREEEEVYSGTITVRIPNDRYQDFLTEAEGMAVKIYDRTVNGEDVTEQYVDLESRLKSKRTVEARLLEFMEKANNTEDLLKISNDLAKTQEEIEQLLGRMNYLENQSSLATVTISMSENKIVVPNLDKQNLNTWEKTKQQFATSLHYLLSFISGLFVFVVGNTPVFIIVGLIALPIFIFLRKRMKNRNSTNQE